MAKIFQDETIVYAIIAGWLIFVGINVNTNIGLLFYMLLATSAFLFIWDKKKTIVLNRDGKIGGGLFQGALLYIGFIAFSILFSNINEILGLLGATTPALADNIILNFITFALVVPIIETLAFIRYLDFFASRFNIDISRKGLFKFSTLSLVSILAFFFMVLHLTAKGVTFGLTLALVFIMMMISLLAAIYFRETKQAIFFHILANLIASLFALGLFAVSNLMLPLLGVG